MIFERGRCVCCDAHLETHPGMISETVSSANIVYLLSAQLDLQRQSESSDNTQGDSQ